MGLSDIWNEIQIFFIDISEYTEAEENRDKYKKVVKELDKRIKRCEEFLSEGKEVVNAFHTQFTCNSDGAEGILKTDFDKAEIEWHEKSMAFIEEMENALEIAKIRKKEAQNKLEYWTDKVFSEEKSVRNRVCQKQEEKVRKERQEKERRQK